MAHIQIRSPHPEEGAGAIQCIINGVDYSFELFHDMELVTVGDDPAFAEVGLRVTFAVSQLDLGDETNVQITDRVPEVARRVEAIRAVSA